MCHMAGLTSDSRASELVGDCAMNKLLCSLIDGGAAADRAALCDTPATVASARHVGTGALACRPARDRVARPSAPEQVVTARMSPVVPRVRSTMSPARPEVPCGLPAFAARPGRLRRDVPSTGGSRLSAVPAVTASSDRGGRACRLGRGEDHQVEPGPLAPACRCLLAPLGLPGARAVCRRGGSIAISGRPRPARPPSSPARRPSAAEDAPARPPVTR